MGGLLFMWLKVACPKDGAQFWCISSRQYDKSHSVSSPQCKYYRSSPTTVPKLSAGFRSLLSLTGCGRDNYGRMFAVVFLESLGDQVGLNLFAVTPGKQAARLRVSAPAWTGRPGYQGELVTVYPGQTQRIIIPSVLRSDGTQVILQQTYHT